jgi:biotin synthase
MLNLTELHDLYFKQQNQRNPDIITRSEAEELLSVTDASIFELLALANKVREKYMEKNISLCSIVNAKSGNCSENCSFCAQSKHHSSNINQYNLLSPDKILSCAIESEKNGALHFGIVTSGHRLSVDDLKSISKGIRLIKSKTNLEVCGSLGILNMDQLIELKEAGLYKYHHNIETAESYFDKICTTHSFQDRVDMVNRVKDSGIKICCGGIIGLGETPEQRIELAFTLKKLDVDSIPINILVPLSGTQLENQEPLEPMEILKTIAIFRLIIPNKVIKLAGGRETNLRELQSLALSSGANGLLIGNYLTMPGQNPEKDLKMIRDLGLQPGSCENEK